MILCTLFSRASAHELDHFARGELETGTVDGHVTLTLEQS